MIKDNYEDLNNIYSNDNYLADFLSSNGIIIFKTYNKKYGFIDLKNDIYTENKYDLLVVVNSNTLISKINDTYQLINNYEETISDNYDEMKKESNGTIIVKRNGKYGLIDYSGKIIFDCLYDGINNKIAYINHEDGIRSYYYNYNGIIYNAHNGIPKYYENDILYECMPKNDQNVICDGIRKFNYSEETDYSRITNVETKEYIDDVSINSTFNENGRFVIRKKINDTLYSFLIDKEFNTYFSSKNYRITKSNHGTYVLTDNENNKELINSDGKYITNKKYKYSDINVLENRLILAKTRNKTFMYDLNGLERELNYDYFSIVGDINSDVLVGKYNIKGQYKAIKYNYIDRNGKEVFKTQNFDEAYKFENNMSICMKYNKNNKGIYKKYYVLDDHGLLKFSFSKDNDLKFKALYYAKESNVFYGKLQNKNKWCILDDKGNIIKEVYADRLDYIKYSETNGYFILKSALLKDNTIRYGIIDEKGNIVLPSIYYNINFINGRFVNVSVPNYPKKLLVLVDLNDKEKYITSLNDIYSGNDMKLINRKK